MITIFTKWCGTGKACPSCGLDTLDGDNMAAWCNSCDWNNFGSY